MLENLCRIYLSTYLPVYLFIYLPFNQITDQPPNSTENTFFFKSY